jgi:transitional endoplasmic reticulum ATPase
MTVQVDSTAQPEQQSRGPRFRVVEARLDDVERGIVRISERAMERMGLQPGDVLRIEGERPCLSRVWPLLPENDHPNHIQMDGLTRENAGLSLDDRITVNLQTVPPATTVLLQPLSRQTIGPTEVRRIREAMQGRALMKGDQVSIALFSRKGTPFQVVSFEPEDLGCISGPYTDVRIQEQTRQAGKKTDTIKYEDIGGLEEELTRIREMIELPVKFPQIFAQLRIEPPKGVLLYGPPGTGKTTIARAVASEIKAHFIRVNGPEIIHKFYGESEAKLRELFDEAQQKAPSIIFIDEIDAIAPKRMDVAGEVEKRVVAQLLALMDGMVARGEVVVIGATNLPELLDNALRRPGRFDREVVVKVPSRPGRLQILRIHTRAMPLDDDVDLDSLAEVTHGFVGADLEVLCKEAGMYALKDLMGRDDFTDMDDTQLIEGTRIGMKHFLDALKGIEPTATREFFAERPNVRWEDVGGQREARELLRSTVELPRRFPKLYRFAGTGAVNGVLVCGPPGGGKTLIVRALATESGFSFITVDAAALFSKWVGESEKALRQVFVKAKQASPCILFFDELDTIFPRRENSQEFGGRERLIGQFLAELDNLDRFSEVMVIGATSRPELLEPALLSPGRFGVVVELQPLSEQERHDVLTIHTRALPLADDVQLELIAEATDGFSGADLASLCNRASYNRLQSFIVEHGGDAEALADSFTIRQEDFVHAMTALRAARSRAMPA